MRSNIIQFVIDIIRGKALRIGLNKLRVLARLKNAENIPLVKVVGDSHTSFFSGNNQVLFKQFEGDINNGTDILKHFITFHVGPALAYNLNRYNSNTKAREKIEHLIKKGYLKQGDTILLCFGCIDTTEHVLKHVDDEHSIEEVCGNILNNYFEYIEKLKSQGFKIYLWGALPQVCAPDNIKFLKINEVVKIFNTLLKERAQKSGIKALFVWDKIMNEKYAADKKYYFDGIHLNQDAWKFALSEVKQIDILKDVDLEKEL